MIQNSRQKKSLAAIVGIAAATALYSLTPKWEGTEYTTYKDMGGVLTYCTGATEDAVWGKTYTKQECLEQLDYDLARHAEGISQCLYTKLTLGQKIAFVDTAYNIGVNAFCGSSMARLANQGKVEESCEALSKWVRVKGKIVKGLVNRRTETKYICLNKK